jgi:hypothetical protein
VITPELASKLVAARFPQWADPDEVFADHAEH